MKTELLKIAQDLEQGTISDNEAQTPLLGVSERTLGFASCASLAKSMPLDQAIHIIKSDITGMPITAAIEGELVVMYVR